MNLKYLNDRILLSRIPITAIAESMGLSRQTLYHKMKGEREFKVSEVLKICELLRLTSEEKTLIFFAKEVDNSDNLVKTAAGNIK